MNALLWEVLEKMPSQRRYRLYDRVAQSWREGAAPLALNYEVARVKLRKLLKRLTSGIFEKNARSQDRTILAEIATLSLTAPLPLCEAVMAQADLFDDNMVKKQDQTFHLSKLASPEREDVFSLQRLSVCVCAFERRFILSAKRRAESRLWPQTFSFPDSFRDNSLARTPGWRRTEPLSLKSFLTEPSWRRAS